MSSTLTRYGFQPEVAKLLLFNRDVNKIADFVIVCELYIRIRMSTRGSGIRKIKVQVSCRVISKIKKEV